MASITLAEASKLGLNDLVSGVIENIVTINPIFNVMPFSEVSGNAKAYNRELTLGDAEALAIGGTITAKAAPTYTQVTTALTTLIGDAEVNGLLMAQEVGENGGNNLISQNIASKAKSVGRKWQSLFIDGDSSVSGEFDGLRAIMSGSGTGDLNGAQDVAMNGALTFAKLDEMLHQVKSKDGQVDFIMMNEREIRAYRALVRALGGSQPEYVEVAGVNMPAYAGIPIYRNDWIANDYAGPGSPETSTEVFAGNFDDGSEKVGMAGLTSATDMGIGVETVGAKETADVQIYRVKFYSSFALFSGLSVARLTGVQD